MQTVVLRGNYLGIRRYQNPVARRRHHHRFSHRRSNTHHFHLPAIRDFPSLGDHIPSLVDPHSDMLMNNDDMFEEDRLELDEWIDNDDLEKGLLEDIIARQMQTKTYMLPIDLVASTEEREPDICVICQDEYKNKEEIGILQCGHEYHGDCIKRWLHEKNVCPICKSKALTIG
ncbi:E3 ubiquitin-protein ligase [Vigna unguiculata]|uniref:RING-type E3 ubiquitin transferase n=1 Tax=Vigna unguiculata TaxID=3917 RepID=A0A4D6LFM8_VIGUN|nr:E3 ubiquitin-protein ligase [Vigna unguiculata]